MKSCRTCLFWDIEAARGKAGRLRPRAIARCRWEFPDIALPDSLKPPTGCAFIAPRPSFMQATDGKHCAGWEEA